ncbi:MAG: hypothetical protein ACPHJ3_12280 [Rubripirellula sp.]
MSGHGLFYFAGQAFKEPREVAQQDLDICPRLSKFNSKWIGNVAWESQCGHVQVVTGMEQTVQKKTLCWIEVGAAGQYLRQKLSCIPIFTRGVKQGSCMSSVKPWLGHPEQRGN